MSRLGDRERGRHEPRTTRGRRMAHPRSVAYCARIPPHRDHCSGTPRGESHGYGTAMKSATSVLVILLLMVTACRSESSPASTVQPTARAAESPVATATVPEAPGLASTRVAPFRQMADALNRGDATAAARVFTDEAVWERGGQCPPGACIGKQAVQRELTRDVTAHHQLTLLSADTATTIPIVRLELRNDGTRRAGVERVIQFFAIEMKNDKISSLRVSFDMSDAVTARFVASQAGTQR